VRYEAPRILIVCSVSSSHYRVFADDGMQRDLSLQLVDRSGRFGSVLIGSGAVMFTGSFGHRLFTYRSNTESLEYHDYR
jgi:hypothetical protein